MNVEHRSIALDLNGTSVSANLFLPVSLPAPSVLFYHGRGSSQARHINRAELLATQGFVALTFDFRGWRNAPSSGYLPTLAEFVEDATIAFDYLAALPEVKEGRQGILGCVDYCDVLWLQSGSWFADIRLRLSPQGPDTSDEAAVAFATEGAFAGIASWTDPTLTWQHTIDLRENPPVDSSPIRWQNGGIIEGGIIPRNGQEVTWAEEWMRLTDDSVVPTVRAGDKQIYIAVGSYAIKINDDRPQGDFTALRYSQIGDEWVEVGRVQGAGR